MVVVKRKWYRWIGREERNQKMYMMVGVCERGIEKSELEVGFGEEILKV